MRTFSSCGKFAFMQSCNKFSSSLTEVAVLTHDHPDNMLSVVRSEFSIRVRNESSDGFDNFWATVTTFDSSNLEIHFAWTGALSSWWILLVHVFLFSQSTDLLINLLGSVSLKHLEKLVFFHFCSVSMQTHYSIMELNQNALKDCLLLFNNRERYTFSIS